MIIEESMALAAGSSLQGLTESTVQIQAAFLQALIRIQKQKLLKSGIGEVALEKLQKSLDRKHEESLSYCCIPAAVYHDMKHFGLLNHSGIRNYSVLSASNNDSLLFFYGSQDHVYVERTLKSMEALYGQRSELDKESFALIAAGKDLLTVRGLNDEELQIFRSLTLCPDSKGNYPLALPYTVLEYKGKKSILLLKQDESLLEKNLSNLAAALAKNASEPSAGLNQADLLSELMDEPLNKDAVDHNLPYVSITPILSGDRSVKRAIHRAEAILKMQKNDSQNSQERIPRHENSRASNRRQSQSQL